SLQTAILYFKQPFALLSHLHLAFNYLIIVIQTDKSNIILYITMSTKRRDFLKLTGLTGLSLVGSSLVGCGTTAGKLAPAARSSKQHFNMSGYAAPKIDTVRIGFIGLGMRGPGAVNRMSHIEGVDIKGLCDLRPEKVNAVQKKLKGRNHNPTLYSG